MKAASEQRRGTSKLIWILAAFVIAFIVWARNAPLDEIVRGSGVLVPSSNAQVVQSLEGGILDEINVREGDKVVAGQVLAKLNETRYRAEVEDFESQIRSNSAKLARLQAELDRQTNLVLPNALSDADPELAASELQLFRARMLQFQSELADAEEQLQLRTDKVELMTGLVAKNAMPEIDLLNEKLAQGDARAARDRILAEFELQRSEEISTLVAEMARLRAQIEQSRDQLERSRLVSPSEGIVNTIYTTTIGGVVQPGEPIFEITPLNDEMLVEVKIQPKDIAFVANDMETTVKLSAYDYTVYGSLSGKIAQVSADTFEDESSPDGQPYYKVLISVDDYSFPKHDQVVEIRPGMLADAEVHVGEKTVFQYLIKPLVKSSEALREP